MSVKTLLANIELPDSLDQFVGSENFAENIKRLFWHNITAFGYTCGGNFDFDMYFRPLRVPKLLNSINYVLERHEEFRKLDLMRQLYK
jgi:hypothetical protein